MCVRSVISHMVWVYIFTIVRLKMPYMATQCLYSNYLVVTINYILNHKSVYKIFISFYCDISPSLCFTGYFG